LFIFSSKSTILFFTASVVYF